MYLSLASIRVDIEFEKDNELMVEPRQESEIKTPSDFRTHCVNWFISKYGSNERILRIEDEKLMCSANVHISSAPKINGNFVSMTFALLINQTESVEHEVKSKNLQVETIEAAIQLVTNTIITSVKPGAKMSADVNWLPLTHCEKYPGITTFPGYDRRKIKLVSGSLASFVWGDAVENILPGSYAPKWSELSKKKDVMALPTDMYDLLHNILNHPKEECTHPFTRTLRLPMDNTSSYIETLAKLLHGKNSLVDPVVYYLSINKLTGDSSDLYDALSLLQGHIVVIDISPVLITQSPFLSSYDFSLIKGNQIRFMIEDNPSILFIIRDGLEHTIAPPNILNLYSKKRKGDGSLDILMNTLLTNLTSYVDLKSYDVSLSDIRRCVKHVCCEMGRPNYTDKITRQLRDWVKRVGCNTVLLSAIYEYVKLYIGYECQGVQRSLYNEQDKEIMNSIIPGYITDNTPESDNAPARPTQVKKSGLAPMKKLDKLVGLHDVKNIVKKLIAHYQFIGIHEEMGVASISNHMIFTGNPGTAKTTTARIMYDILVKAGRLKPNRFVEVGRQDLVGQYVGQTAPKVKEAFDRAIGGMLFVDEAYSLSIKNAGGFGEEAVATLVQEMENHRDDVIVILAGYKDEMEQMVQINPGLRSRISFTIDFPDYTSDELVDITFSIASDMGYTISSDAIDFITKKFSEEKLPVDLGNGRFARNLVEHAIINHSMRMMDGYTGTCYTLLNKEDLENAWSEVYKPKKVHRAGF